MGDALPVHAPSSPDPIPSRLAYFPPQIGYENKVMVELGERMLLVAILGTVSVLGAFVSVTAAYHMQLGSVSKQTGCAAVRTMPLPEPATKCAPASKLYAIVAAPRCTRRTPGTPHHHHLVRGLSASNVGCLSPYG